MAAKKLRRFVVTFQEEFPIDKVNGMLETDFMGWGKTFSGKDPRVLFLYPFPDASYEKVKRTLDELCAGGALTYIEDWQ